MNQQIRVWIDETGTRQPVFVEVLEIGKRALDENGIQIPYPHLQLFWDDVEIRVVEKLRPLASRESAA